MQIRFASEKDNQDLLRLARSTPMEGKVVVKVNRSPDYFMLANLQGDDARVLVAEKDGELVGAIGFSFRQVIIGRRTHKIAYLGGIKLAESVRKGIAAYRLVKATSDYLLSTDVEYGVLLVMEGNAAMEALLSGRAGIPRFYRISQFELTYLLPLLKPSINSDFQIRAAQPADEFALFDLWRNFHLNYELRPASLEKTWQMLMQEPSFSLQNFYVALKGTQVVAAVSIWDQQAFKQTIVEHYGGSFRLVAKLLSPWQVLPKAGQPLRELNLRYLVYQPEQEAAAQALVRHLVRQFRHNYQMLRLGVPAGVFPATILQGLLRFKMRLNYYITCRELTSDNLQMINSLRTKPVWEDLCLH